MKELEDMASRYSHFYAAANGMLAAAREIVERLA